MVRLITLNAGAFFVDGMEIYNTAAGGIAMVPPNNTAVAQYSYAYVYFDANGVLRFDCTALGAAVPAGAIPLYRFTVPVGNTSQNDPQLASVTQTDIRRVEAGYPEQFNSIAYVSVPLPFNMLDAEYAVQLDILDYKGGYNQRPIIHVDNKASNGFSIKAEGTLDAVRVRWTAIKPSL